jgi:hypothetical protein
MVSPSSLAHFARTAVACCLLFWPFFGCPEAPRLPATGQGIEPWPSFLQDGGPANNFPPLEAALVSLEQAQCEQLSRCGVFASPPDCTASTPRLDALHSESLASGRSRIDQPSLEACLDKARRNTRCSVSLDQKCQWVPFLPNVPRGGPCLLNAECQADDTCTARSSCAGICVARTAIGATPDSNGRCVSGAYLDESGICVAQRPVGSPCPKPSLAFENPCANDVVCQDGFCRAVILGGGPGTDGSPCGGDTPACAIGLSCVDSICRPLRKPAEACDQSRGLFCQADLYCSVRARPGSCLARKGRGEPCELDQCAESLTCAMSPVANDSPTCRPQLPGVGEACTVVPGVDSIPMCAPGTTCSTEGTCLRLPPIGQPCLATPRGGACAEGALCDTSTSRCVTRVCPESVGEP